MNNSRTLLYLLLLTGLFVACSPNQKQVDLSGRWAFQTDPTDVGLKEQWYNKPLNDTIFLPGSMVGNNKGDIPSLTTQWTGTIYDSSFFFNPALEKYRHPGNIKFPFWLSPNYHYVDAAWYSREINIPENWQNKRVVLNLERPHWQTKVWIDDQAVGTQKSLSTPHCYDLTAMAPPGQHRLTIRVDNRLDPVNVGPDSHSVSDHTQGNWNGIVGDISVKAQAPVYIGNMQLFPNPEKKMVKVILSLANSRQEDVDGELRFRIEANNFQARQFPDLLIKVHFSGKQKVLDADIPMGDNFKSWDEFHPNLYRLTACVTVNKQTDEQTVNFGMRSFRVEGDHFEINGRPVFLRGTLECNTFPLTGYPPTDEDGWEKVFSVCKESGFNHIRFHSHCPPEAAFRVADRMGLYLQVEAPSWPNHGTSLGDGQPTDQYLIDETARIIKTYGNHPSFVMYAWGNEPRGAYVPFLDKQLKTWKAKDNRRVYTAASIGMSWSVNPESQYLVRSGPRGLPFKQQPNSSFNYSEKIADENRPYVTHEMGQWCVFPDFSEIENYTGVLKAKNFELFKQDLQEKHMGDQAHDFLMASGKLQALCYKAEIEAALRTPQLDGFQLLGLNDFPGQGTALIGMLNVFWQEKGYITKTEIHHFCNETVPLAELPKFVFTTNERFTANLLVAHFGENDLETKPVWKIISPDGEALAEGQLARQTIPTGSRTNLGTINVKLGMVRKAGKYTLTVKLNTFENSWDFWVYPATLPLIENDAVYTTTSLDRKAEKILKAGGKVFLDASGLVENGKDVVAYFTPVFWNTSWFKMRPPHTLGILVQNEHPVFTDFPTESHSNYQWWNILSNQQVMQLDSFPESLRPLVQPIDTWFLNRRLAQLFEVNVGPGKLMVSSLRLSKDPGEPVARQLDFSIRKYMNSDRFNPRTSVDAAVIRELFEKKDRRKINLYTKASPDELKPNHQTKK